MLDEAGLGRLVDGVVSSAMAGAAKPDRALFEAALGLAGTPPDRAVYVGDSPANDVAGAAAAGLRAILLRRGANRLDRTAADASTSAEPLAVIAGLHDLPRVI